MVFSGAFDDPHLLCLLLTTLFASRGAGLSVSSPQKLGESPRVLHEPGAGAAGAGPDGCESRGVQEMGLSSLLDGKNALHVAQMLH